MKLLLSIFLSLLLPLQLFASVAPTTTQYLREAGTDPWVVMARVARGEEGGVVAVDTTSVFSLAKSILALAATGGDPNDAVQTFLQTFIHDGQIGDSAFLNDDFWGLLALSAGGVSAIHPAVADARSFILRSQHASGGWSWSAAPDTPDTDDTAAAVMALLETGVSANDLVIIRALAFLQSQENADGGFPNIPEGPSSIDSTAWVAMALQKAGKDASRAQEFLQSTMRDDGSWGSPATTSFATIALSGKWFPVMPITRLAGADSVASPTADTLPRRGDERRSAGEPSAFFDRVESRGFPPPPRSFVPSKPPLSSPERRTTDSAPQIFFPPPFLPGISAQSVFSRKETVTVVRAAVDSDGDGYPDDVEIVNGYDPYDPRPVKKSKVQSLKSKVKKQKSK